MRVKLVEKNAAMSCILTHRKPIGKVQRTLPMA